MNRDEQEGGTQHERWEVGGPPVSHGGGSALRPLTLVLGPKHEPTKREPLPQRVKKHQNPVL